MRLCFLFFFSPHSVQTVLKRGGKGGRHTQRHVRHMLIGQLRIHCSRRPPAHERGKMSHYSLFAHRQTYSRANLITISIMAPPAASLPSLMSVHARTHTHAHTCARQTYCSGFNSSVHILLCPAVKTQTPLNTFAGN